jgi:hypothetical protein
LLACSANGKVEDSDPWPSGWMTKHRSAATGTPNAGTDAADSGVVDPLQPAASGHAGGVAGASGKLGASGAGGSSGSSALAGTGGSAGASGKLGAGGESGASGASGGSGAGGHAPSRGVLMRGYDLKRTGANLQETLLTAANVTPAKFGKRGCYVVDGQIYAQILYLDAFDFGAQGTHDAIVVATMKNHIYVLDAEDPSLVLWDRSYGTAVGPASAFANANHEMKCYPSYLDITQWVGILSTPTIDLDAGALYFVARSNETGRQVQKLYAVNLVDGTNRAASPVTIDATYAGSGDQGTDTKDPVTGGKFPFDQTHQNQRSALSLHDGIVYIAWASFCDYRPYHGWLIGYDAKTLQQVVVFNTTPNGDSGGIWMSGAGPAFDDDGTIYLTTGNGSADLKGGQNHAQSLLKLRRQAGTLQVVDWFIPYEYDFLEYDDRDLGSAGVLLVPGTNMVLAGGKQAKIYVADKTNLGKFTPPTAAFQPPANGKPLVLASGTDAVLQTLDVATMSTPPNAHNHSTPTYWKSDAGEFVYTMAEEDNLRQWRLQNGRLELYKVSVVRAPDEPKQSSPDGSGYTMPGGTMTLSANGSNPDSGIVWVSMPIGLDANNAVVPGVVYAFAANDVSHALWNSQANAARDSVGNYAKFNPVTVYNGMLYVPTFDDTDAANKFCAYGPVGP